MNKTLRESANKKSDSGSSVDIGGAPRGLVKE
jgi:hypothetical protein